MRSIITQIKALMASNPPHGNSAGPSRSQSRTTNSLRTTSVLHHIIERNRRFTAPVSVYSYTMDLRPRSPQRIGRFATMATSGDGDDHADQDSGARSSFDVERTGLLSQLPEGSPRSMQTGSQGTSRFAKDHDGSLSQRAAAAPIDWTMTALLFFFPALGGALFGFDIGASSGALLSMRDPQLSGTDWYSMSTFQSGLVVSLSLGGALIGSAAALLRGDAIGRKREILLASILYFSGSLIVALAPTLPAVFVGRTLYGIGIGFAMNAAPAYIAESSPPRVRGLLISLKEVFIVVGILSGYGIGAYAVDMVGGWRYMYGAAMPAAVLLAVGMAWLPESPRWLILSGKGIRDAAAALRRTKGSVYDEALAHAELESIASATGEDDRTTAVTTANPFGQVFQPRYRRPLAVGLSLMLFQQITGQPSVLYYAGKIFQDAGFASAGAATAISVVLGAFKLVLTGVAVATVDSWGRRPLLLAGISGIIAALVGLWGVQSGLLPLPENVAEWGSVGALLLYVGAYQMSFGPISWLIVGEVFPLRVRGQAIALATLTNFASNFGVSLVLPTLQDAFGPAALYLGFATIGVVALVTVNSIVPETKGRTLEEIEKMWATEDEGMHSS